MFGINICYAVTVLLLLLGSVISILCNDVNISKCDKGFPYKKDLKANGLILETIAIGSPAICVKLCAATGGCEAVSYHKVEAKCLLNFNINNTPINAPGWLLFNDLEWAKTLLGPCNKQMASGRRCYALNNGQTIDLHSHCLDTISVDVQVTGTIEQRTVGTSLPVTCTSGTVTNVICTTKGAWSEVCLQIWPTGVYTLLQPETGCPDGFSSGSVQLSMPSGSNSGKSSPYHVKGSVSSDSVTWNFCTKDVSVESDNWPAGSYCILMNTSCPEGFSSGHFHIYQLTDIAIQGVVPPIYTKPEATPFICCRDDGLPTTPIILPTSKPFVLFKYKSDCQSVQGMSSEAEYTYFDDKIVEASREFHHYKDTALATYSPTGITLYFCYYSR